MGFRASLRDSNREPLMSALGQKQTSWHLQRMSALPPKADIADCDGDVRFVPEADIKASARRCAALLRRPAGGSREYSSVSTGWRINGKYEFKAGTAGVGF